MAHTPGPWEAVSSDEYYGTYFIQACVRANAEEECANERLIAAAPDLLEALKACIHALNDDGAVGHVEAEDMALAAITKAEIGPQGRIG